MIHIGGYNFSLHKGSIGLKKRGILYDIVPWQSPPELWRVPVQPEQPEQFEAEVDMLQMGEGVSVSRLRRNFGGFRHQSQE
ncbi:unnamed protein product, partial [Iphiclides podalirius]